MSPTRRDFLRRATGAALTGAGTLAGLRAALAAGQAPAIVGSDRDRPSSAFGVTAGDVDGDRAIIWSRTDRPARFVVEYSTTAAFADVRRVTGPTATAATDFTARVDLRGLPAGQRIFYRARFEGTNERRLASAPLTGTFTTAAARPQQPTTIVWTADTVGQGWGINPDLGGMRLYQTMRGVEADVFVHAGDTIYADNPLKPEVTLDDGRVWKNLVTPEKSKVAETLDEFRGNHRYNLLDEHVRAFNASLSQFAIWDDHEVLNNWYPSEILGPDMPYTERRVAVLAARAKQAFLEYTPIRIDLRDPDRVYRAVRVGPLAEIFGFDMRSYRGANSPNVEPTRSPASAILGRAQIEWLERRLLASTATWKVIASDMPLGLVVPDGKVYEAVANRDDGPPLGRELEIGDLLRFIRDRGIRNVVFITGDVHYCAAHHYDPSRAGFTAFHPFWEFVAGPAHAGTFGAVPLDRTFGPEVRFIGVPKDMKPNRPPSDGLQFFGVLRIDPVTRALTASLRNLAGETLFSVDLAPENERRG